MTQIPSLHFSPLPFFFPNGENIIPPFPRFLPFPSSSPMSYPNITNTDSEVERAKGVK